MQKILEIKGNNWVSGLANNPYLALGGGFQTVNNIDPFELPGVAMPGVTPTVISTATSPKILTSWNAGGADYIYAHSKTKLYQIMQDSPYTITDVTAQLGFQPYTDISGAIIWKNKYVYVGNSSGGTTLFTNSLPVSITNEIPLLSAFVVSNYTPMAIGSDGNLYVGDGDDRVYIITNPSGTTGNANYFQLDVGFRPRDIMNDGRYLVILADNNSILHSDLKPGNYKCKVYFWDMQKAVADIAFEVNDSYLIAGEFMDGSIYFFGYNGLYVCNSGTPPQLVRSFISTYAIPSVKPYSPYHLTKSKGSLYWVDNSNNGATNTSLYAYGCPNAGGKKIFYTPNSLNLSGFQNLAVISIGNKFWVSNIVNEINILNNSSTRGQSVIKLLNFIADRPYRYDFIKITLTKPIASGQGFVLIVTNFDGTITYSQNTVNFNPLNPKQTFTLRPNKPAVTTRDKFEDLQISILLTGASIQRISVYATPLEDANEEI